jgi:hypothetical protein
MSRKTGIVLKKLKALNKPWHPESGLVFKSSKEKMVIGRYDKDDGELMPLDEEILELCKKWRFKYDESLLEEEEPEEEEQEDNEEEDNEEVEDNEEEEQEEDNEQEQEEDNEEEEQEEDNEQEEEVVDEPVKPSKLTKKSGKSFMDEYNKLVDNFNGDVKFMIEELEQRNQELSNKLSAKEAELTKVEGELQDKEKELIQTKEKLKKIKSMFE